MSDVSPDDWEKTPPLVYELFQNSWDEQGVTRVDAELVSSGRGKDRLTVRDDAPDGFKDLSHAFTLFAESLKKGDPKKRGRFNFGEKLVLAMFTQEKSAGTVSATVPCRPQNPFGSLVSAS